MVAATWRPELVELEASEGVESFDFLKVEDFFEERGAGKEPGYKSWSTVGRVLGYQLVESYPEGPKNGVALTVDTSEGVACCLLLRFSTPWSMRLRFDPRAATAAYYTTSNTRSIVLDDEGSLERCLTHRRVSGRVLATPLLDVSESDAALLITVRSAAAGPGDTADSLHQLSGGVTMQVVVYKRSYRCSVWAPDGAGGFREVHTDADCPLYFKKRLCAREGRGCTTDYSILQAKVMPPKAKYIGFGEKGGFDLCRNGARLTFFNFDNMRYRQIYGNGPGDAREPLYDSNPFFLEFSMRDGRQSICGLFVDNTSETCFDLGSYTGGREYLFGNLYGSLDYYLFVGSGPQEVLESYYHFVGKSRLKPRYSLGNHQGCYGYEEAKDLYDCARGYRSHQIPLDGLHVDVDLQENYCTFTMDEGKFPSGVFDELAEGGIKCSTNITPVVSYTNWGYPTYESGNKNELFVTAAQAGERSSNASSQGPYYQGGVYYGGNRGTFGHYPDLGRREVRRWWGQQYRLLYSRGLEMVWQDMTTPAIPDPKEQPGVQLEAPRFQASWYIADKISSSYRSFPFDQLLTDNSLSKYSGEVGARTSGFLGQHKCPAARIRNLYAYNLHKATYHGLNHIWCVNDYTFTCLGSEGLTRAEACEINEALKKLGILRLLPNRSYTYEVNSKLDYADPAVRLGLPVKYQQYESEVREVLKQSTELEARRKNRRNFIVGRGGFTGMHRFAALWTGDNASQWDFLKINVTQVLALGLAGQSMAGQDIGGFEPAMGSDERWVDPELFCRWVSMGAFLPWCRNHYSRKGSKEFQEPYEFHKRAQEAPEEERHYYRAVLPIARYYLQLRYRLMQLLYDGLFANTMDGLPFVKPLFLTDVDFSLLSDRSHFLNTQFMVGNDLLVAPVLEKESAGGRGSRLIYLPHVSDWYAFKNSREPLGPAVPGGTEFLYHAPVGEHPDHVPFILPMYVRAGAILPTVEVEQYVGELRAAGKENPTTVNIYPGGGGHEYLMYEDDGVSRSSAPKGLEAEGADPAARSEFRKTRITHRFVSAKEREVELNWLHNNYVPPEAYLFVAIVDDPSYPAEPVGELRLRSKNIDAPVNERLPKIEEGSTEERAEALRASRCNAWYYNPEVRISFAKLFFPRQLRRTRGVSALRHRDSYDSPSKAPSYVLRAHYK